VRRLQSGLQYALRWGDYSSVREARDARQQKVAFHARAEEHFARWRQFARDHPALRDMKHPGEPGFMPIRTTEECMLCSDLLHVGGGDEGFERKHWKCARAGTASTKASSTAISPATTASFPSSILSATSSTRSTAVNGLFR